jgi:hypothetical protein
MRNLTEKTFILMMNGQIEAIAKSWNDIRDYCSETGKRGDAYVLESVIPLGGNLGGVKTDIKFFGKIE